MQYEFSTDEKLGRSVLTNHGASYLIVNGRTDYNSGIEVACRARLLTSEKRKNVSLQLVLAKDLKDPRDPGINLTLSASHGSPSVSLLVRAPHLSRQFNLTLDPYPTISPVLAENVRRPLEAAMAAVPAVADKWLNVRCYLEDDLVRVWLDDRLVADLTETEVKAIRDEVRKTELQKINEIADEAVKAARLKAFQAMPAGTKTLPTAGGQQVTLSAGAQLAELQVTNLSSFAGNRTFETIALDGYVNDRELLGKSGTAVSEGLLPFGETAGVGGVPFRFANRPSAGGPDHIDVGESLLRQANMEGYFPSNRQRFIGASAADPARIQLRIPNGRYDALYVIAAFDEGQNSIPNLTASGFSAGGRFSFVFDEALSGVERCLDGSVRPV